MNYRIMVSLSWIIVFSWMVLIYVLSDQPAIQSSHLSESITEFIVGSSAEAISFDRWNFLVRKNAHLFNYLVLGILVMNALTRQKLGVEIQICCLVMWYMYSLRLHR